MVTLLVVGSNMLLRLILETLINFEKRLTVMEANDCLVRKLVLLFFLNIGFGPIIVDLYFEGMKVSGRLLINTGAQVCFNVCLSLIELYTPRTLEVLWVKFL